MGSWRGSRPVSLWIRAQDHKPTGLRALWGQGWATAHNALGAPQKEAQGVSCFPCGKGGSLGGVHSWRLQARGLTGRRARGVGAPGDRSRLGVPTPVPTPGRRDKLIVTPFPSPCGAPGSLSQCRKLTHEAKPAFFPDAVKVPLS